MKAPSGWGSKVYKPQGQGLEGCGREQGRGTGGGETVGRAECQPEGTLGLGSPGSEDRTAWGNRAE